MVCNDGIVIVHNILLSQCWLCRQSIQHRSDVYQLLSAELQSLPIFGKCVEGTRCVKLSPIDCQHTPACACHLFIGASCAYHACCFILTCALLHTNMLQSLGTLKNIWLARTVSQYDLSFTRVIIPTSPTVVHTSPLYIIIRRCC